MILVKTIFTFSIIWELIYLGIKAFKKLFHRAQTSDIQLLISPYQTQHPSVINKYKNK